MNIKNLKIEGSQNHFIIRLNFKYTLITAIVITIGFTAYLAYPKSDYTNEALFDQYYRDLKYEGRAGDTETGAIVKALALVESEHYSEAIVKFKEISGKGKYFAEAANWYLGLCLLKTHAEEDTILNHFCAIVTKRGKYSSSALEILYKRQQHQQKKKPQKLSP
ncbi:MAG: hypothetical protein N4A59_06315 [Marinifilum sp.]|jgi:hypothetical protein|nr:hypothetical protein [Marinifilum sp.]